MVVACFDTTGVIYTVLVSMTTDVTGSFFLTTLVISLILMVLALGLRIPVEISAIILLPIHLGFLACLGTDWLAITGTILIYLGILLGKNFFFR